MLHISWFDTFNDVCVIVNAMLSIAFMKFFVCAFDLHTLRVFHCKKICILCCDDLESNESLETRFNSIIKIHVST